MYCNELKHCATRYSINFPTYEKIDFIDRCVCDGELQS